MEKRILGDAFGLGASFFGVLRPSRQNSGPQKAQSGLKTAVLKNAIVGFGDSRRDKSEERVSVVAEEQVRGWKQNFGRRHRSRIIQAVAQGKQGRGGPPLQKQDSIRGGVELGPGPNARDAGLDELPRQLAGVAARQKPLNQRHVGRAPLARDKQSVGAIVATPLRPSRARKKPFDGGLIALVDREHERRFAVFPKGGVNVEASAPQRVENPAGASRVIALRVHALQA